MSRQFGPKGGSLGPFACHFAHPTHRVLPNTGAAFDHRSASRDNEAVDVAGSVLHIVNGIDHGKQQDLLTFLPNKLGCMSLFSLPPNRPHLEALQIVKSASP